jgi:hypothetical protein
MKFTSRYILLQTCVLLLVCLRIFVFLWQIPNLVNYHLFQNHVLFEVNYKNAWTSGNSGFFIDSSGDVYKFTDEPGNSDIELLLFLKVNRKRGEPPYSTYDLMADYGLSNQIIYKVDQRTLCEKNDLIELASNGGLSSDDPLTPDDCATRDAGILSYRAFIFNETSKTYSPVDLYTIGDMLRVNLSQEGRDIYEWLEALCIEENLFWGCNSEHLCKP